MVGREGKAGADFEVDGLPGRTIGAGPRDLVLLHGFTGSAEAWPLPALDALARSHRVWLVDLPGHGGSLIDPEDVGGWSVWRTVDRLRSLASHIGGPARWLGYSMGGRLALLAAVAGVPMAELLLESASPGIASPEEREDRRTRDDALADELDRIVADGEFGAFVDRWMALPLFDTQRGLPPEVRAEERARRLRASPRRWAAALRGLGTGRQPSLWGRLGEVACPVALLNGARDAKFDAIAARMAAGLREVRREVAAGAGHAVHLEAPEAWVRWVEG